MHTIGLRGHAVNCGHAVITFAVSPRSDRTHVSAVICGRGQDYSIWMWSIAVAVMKIKTRSKCGQNS